MILLVLTLIGTVIILALRTDGDRIPLRVFLGSRSVSKLPFVLAMDQGLFEKHGLDVRIQMPSPDFEGGIESTSDGPLIRAWWRLRYREPPPFDITVDGGSPFMVRRTLEAREPRMIQLAGTDCVARSHIIARHGINSLEELKGKRLGISMRRATTGFVALLLAERMGWDPDQDISIMLNGRHVEELRDGVVDAIVAAERAYAGAKQDGFPVLADTREWGESLSGNSVLVDAEWLEDPTNREAARRFLMATAEGIALFHQDRELALDVLARWHGIEDREYAETMYERGAWTPREPFPCYEGIQRTMELYDSNEMRRYTPEDFFDDSLIKELVESGFVAGLYR